MNITTNGSLQGMEKQMQEEGFDTEGDYIFLYFFGGEGGGVKGFYFIMGGGILVIITTNGSLQGMEKQMQEEGFDTEGICSYIIGPGGGVSCFVNITISWNRGEQEVRGKVWGKFILSECSKPHESVK